MSFIDMLGVTASVAVAVERTSEIIKPIYLKIKNCILKTEFIECSSTEKSIMSIILGILICILTHVRVDIPGINEASLLQEILAGLISSLGSNVLHNILSILTAIKNTTEARAARK